MHADIIQKNNLTHTK